jgi:hypothetical protein
MDCPLSILSMSQWLSKSHMYCHSGIAGRCDWLSRLWTEENACGSFSLIEPASTIGTIPALPSLISQQPSLLQHCTSPSLQDGHR